MCTERNISSLIVFSTLVVTVFIVNASMSTASTASITVSDTKSTLSDIVTSSRQKRAPGWGKRAPGWGKRTPSWDTRQSGDSEFFNEFDNDYDVLNNRVDALKQAVYMTRASLPAGRIDHDLDKRAPGWGKRCCSEDEFSNNLTPERSNAIPIWYQRSAAPEISEVTEIVRRAPGWGKRAPGWGKRAPGWGKRNYHINLDADESESGTTFHGWDNNNIDDQEMFENSDNVFEHSNSNAGLKTGSILSGDIFTPEKRAPGWGKRAPGWGKRNFQFESNYEGNELDKRAPGWGKRAPGWGKRAPGWGKRAPGWGKRSYEIEMDTTETDKRAPGWGKRTVSRVKRTSHSTTPSAKKECQSLQSLENDYIARVKELATRRTAKCGNVKVVNEPTRK